MGSGNWSTTAYSDYTYATKNVSLSNFTSSTSYTAQSLFKARRLSPVLDPKNVMRECRDSEEHPNTVPVILALDVTGSMGRAAVNVAQKLNQIMTDLYADDSVQDIEFCIMGIGDFYCDDVPLQISQFESDVRIAEQLDEIYFEGGGGGNSYESYSAAWYMGVNHCDLDCWKRGKKGIIITLGDELPNPYIPKEGYCGGFKKIVGDGVQEDIDTIAVLNEALQKFDIYHISIDDPDSCYQGHNRNNKVDKEWKTLLGEDKYYVSTIKSLPQIIVNIIKSREDNIGITGIDPWAEIETFDNSFDNENNVVGW